VDSEREAAAPHGASPPPLDGAAEAGPAEGTSSPATAPVAEAGGPAGRPAEAGGPAEADAEPVGEGIPDPEPFDEAELRERARKADTYLDLAQRTQADFDNYRKRMVREVRAAEARGIGRLARELLPALDNLERALAAVESSDPDHQLTKGVRLVTAELSAALGRTGIEGYSPAGEPFDPTRHEAVAQQPVDGAEPGTVVQVLQSGYRLNEAILRPARVIVAS
jgi:molecular chaperone GrpE